jgi:hypothetical protein
MICSFSVLPPPAPGENKKTPASALRQRGLIFFAENPLRHRGVKYAEDDTYDYPYADGKRL